MRDERSRIILSDDVEGRFESLKSELHPARVVGFLRDDFKIDDAKAVVAEAYISEASVKYIVLAATQYNIYSQNALLKLLEEPPHNIVFILIAPAKSALLPTVRSRLPVVDELAVRERKSVDLPLGRLDLQSLYTFVTSLERLDRHEAKALIEAIFYRAVSVEKLALNEAQTEAFERAYRLIEVNARLQNVLLMLLGTFLPESRRAH